MPGTREAIEETERARKYQEKSPNTRKGIWGSNFLAFPELFREFRRIPPSLFKSGTLGSPKRLWSGENEILAEKFGFLLLQPRSGWWSTCFSWDTAMSSLSCQLLLLAVDKSAQAHLLIRETNTNCQACVFSLHQPTFGVILGPGRA